MNIQLGISLSGGPCLAAPGGGIAPSMVILEQDGTFLLDQDGTPIFEQAY